MSGRTYDYLRLRCDCCGRYMTASPGASFIEVPEIEDGYPGDERSRCPTCTRQHGPCVPWRSIVRAEMVCWTIPEPAEVEATVEPAP